MDVFGKAITSMRLKTGDELVITTKSHVHGNILEYISEATKQISGGGFIKKKISHLIELSVMTIVLKQLMKMKSTSSEEKVGWVKVEWLKTVNPFHQIS